MADIAKLIYKKNTLYAGWSEPSNVKAFPLSWTWSSASVLAEAQAVFDYYNAGNTPVVIYNGNAYLVEEYLDAYPNWLTFKSAGVQGSSNWTSSWLYNYYILLNYNWDTVTSVSFWMGSTYNFSRFLSVDANYSTPYTPQYDGSPATKKYVDDMVWDIETLLSNI